MNLFLLMLKAQDKLHEPKVQGDPLHSLKLFPITHCQKILPESHNQSYSLETKLPGASFYFIYIHTQIHTKMDYCPLLKEIFL